MTAPPAPGFVVRLSAISDRLLHHFLAGHLLYLRHLRFLLRGLLLLRPILPEDEPMLQKSFERLTPEQLAAIPLPGPAQAEQATRLTQQADREAQQAREAERRRELELQRWRAYDHFYGSIGYWHGYPRRWGWGAGYYFP